MTSEEKVLYELKEKIALLFMKIEELRVTEQDRRNWDKEKEAFQSRIDDYKTHKAAFEKRVKEWNSRHQ